ncbi:MAG: serine/threonine protein kinase [Iphinoe sp. HA4291-MV1]|nr:serine/threonine protein kinase [Iphinoe sp. HA4291-MV1]
MSLCINPHCQKPENPDNILFCQNCGSELLLEGRYRAMRRLGGGGFGVTFEVNEIRSNISKVLKVLINNQPKAVELFQREAEVLALLNHPGIPKVESNSYFVYFPRDSQQPLHCLVMEKVEGLDLYEYMKQRGYHPINQKLAVQWLTEIVTILQQVHSQNFFHRDIKPPNIMLRADGRLVLIDFGTARAMTQTYWFAQSQGNVTGVISAGYTPTEQMNGQAVPQSDFYALGRTFVYLLTGKEPTDPAIYDSYNNESRWRSYAPNISSTLADLIDRMMAHLPSQRPANTQEILQRLAAIDQALNPPQRPFTPTQPVNSPGVPPTQPVTPQPTPSQPVSGSKPPVKFQLTPSEKRLWNQWVFANVVGMMSGGFLLPFTQWLVLRQRIQGADSWRLATVLSFILSYLVLLPLGIMQWLVLRRQVLHAGWWILGSIVGVVLGYVVGDFASDIVYAIVSNAGVKIPTTPTLDDWRWIVIYAIGIAVGGAIYGAITGRVLIWLLRHPVSKP